MEILVGVTQDQQGEDAIALGLAIARARNDKVTFAHIYPTAFDFVSPARVDHEWRQFLMDEAKGILDWAQEQVDDYDNVEFVTSGHKSSGVGLHQLATVRGSTAIVIGSAPGASKGRISVGSTANQLFHESPIPVAVAPMAYAKWAPQQIARVVLAYRKGSQLITALADMLQESGSPGGLSLKLITVLAEPSRFQRFRGKAATQGDDPMQELRNRTQATLNAAADQIEAAVAVRPECEIIEAEGIGHAISRFQFDDADLLMMGTPSSAPLKRVFLSDVTYKMIRSATVPIVVSPLRS